MYKKGFEKFFSFFFLDALVLKQKSKLTEGFWSLTSERILVHYVNCSQNSQKSAPEIFLIAGWQNEHY